MPGRPIVYNWRQLHNEYDKQDALNLREWCELKELNYTGTSREFTAIEKEDAKRHLEKAQRILAKSLPGFARGIEALSQDDDKNIQLKAISIGMDRAGLSPQAVMVNISNTANIAFVMAPIFAASAIPMMDKFLGERKDADTESND